jgi:predicted dehydrogenase
MSVRPSPARVGVVGCGTISHTYLEHAGDFGLDVVAVSDIDLDRARQAAERHGVSRASATDQLLASDDVEIVLDLTIPAAHAEVDLAAIAAGKHVYTEKPLAVEREGGRRQLEAAAAAGVRLGVAPDTFLGAGIQTCRALIDEGAIGTPLSGTMFMTGHGHESWHPSPEFYYRPGGGPLFDMGPYYLTAMIALLGPVRGVSAAARTGFEERTIGSGPRSGTSFPVEVETHVAGLLEFASGALVNLIMSFDVWVASLPFFEIYGSEGTISGPDPNGFSGPVRLWRPSTREWRDAPLRESGRPQTRGMGLADLAESLAAGGPHRASGELGYHVLDVMCCLLESARAGARVAVGSTCERPAPVTPLA